MERARHHLARAESDVEAAQRFLDREATRRRKWRW
jgi:hypothetical protein